MAGSRNPGSQKHRGGNKKKFAQAVQAGKKRNYQRAILILEELLSEDDAPPEGYLLLGRAFHALKDYSRALAAFNDYLRVRPLSGAGYFFAGRTCLTLGMPQRAVLLLRKALDLNPEDPQTMALLGMAYLKSKHSRAAVALLQGAVENVAETTRARGKPQLPPGEQARIYRAYLNALLIRGIRLCRNEDYPSGIPMLRFVLENGSDSPLLRLELGRAFREMGKPEEALEHYSRALDFAPWDPNIRWYRASILMTLGRNAEALDEIEVIRSSDTKLRGSLAPERIWNSESVDLFMIRSFLETGEWRRAGEACRNWLKYRGKDPMIHAMYAEALRNLKDFTAAQNHLDRALDLEPRRIELWYARIFIAWEGSDWKRLKRALASARALGGDPELINRFWVLYESKTGGDYQHIIAGLQNAIRSFGPEAELMYALGEAYLKTGITKAALNWFRKTRELLETYEPAYLGEIAALETLWKEGLVSAGGELKTAYREYLNRWPDNYIIRREEALFLVRIGDYISASRELEQLLAWEPANSSLRRVLAYAYRKIGRYREAAVFLKSLLKEKPRNVQLLLEYSGCLERAGAPEYALMILKQARHFLQKSPDIPLALGILFFRQEKYEEARNFFKEAAAKAP
ncbi:MAG: tetratricopeptide repeat protein, partial [Treponema sp.]|nr:tetratricopeptide repeat protein [Treponema sp.]